jgi:uncharacterized membrane protein (DUF2068 family)
VPASALILRNSSGDHKGIAFADKTDKMRWFSRVSHESCPAIALADMTLSGSKKRPLRPAHPSGPRGFQIIGAMKLASGSLAVAAGFGIFRLMNKDLGEIADHYIMRMHLDPENRLVHALLAWIYGVQHSHLMVLVVGTISYALLHFVEGTGLLLRQRWAAYLTSIATGSLLPLELFEIARKPRPLRITVFVFNLLILAYVVIKLRQELREENRSENALSQSERRQ